MIINRATVYGGGLIGSGWALCFLTHGVNVTVYDLDDEKLNLTKDNIERVLDFFTEPNISVLTGEQKEECISRVTYTSDVRAAVEQAEFIQENGPEKLPIKQSIIKTIEQYNTTAIIASSTSGLLISDIAAEAKYPERIIAGHPYNPVHLVPLVELAKGDVTSQEVIDKAYQFYKEIGKEPIVLMKECKAFICNRLQNALNREAQDLVYRGVCSVEDVDKAVTFGPGLRWGLMGPHMILELAGGKGGIHECMTKYKISEETFKDMAKWTQLPEGYIEMARKGVEDEFINRTVKEGKNHDELERFRDEGLINLLKFHQKF
ncbi:MAG: 3-hydroxyacyl-CoA dehydrogenase family protein [Eubacteriales bacterium]